MPVLKLFLLLALPLALFSCANAPEEGSVQAGGPAAIVLVAFGTAVPEARAVFGRIEQAARARYPGREIHWAFTAESIVAKLRAQGVEWRSLPEALAELRSRGVAKVAAQSMHIAPGQENARMLQAPLPAGMQVAWGKPLLAAAADRAAVLEALAPEIHEDAANVIIAHGNNRHPEFNEALIALDREARARFPLTVVCTVEGQPGTGGLAEARDAAARLGRVHFVPLMLTAGDHVLNDVLGDGPDSWKSIVGAPQTACAPPLGENDAVLRLYFAHLDEALAWLEQ